MKFLHTSNLHYGATPDANRPWGAERAKAVKDAFARILRASRREGIDTLIIAGDLFDAIPTADELNEVNEGFRSIAPVKVVIIAGKGKKLFSAAPDSDFIWAENVTYVSSGNDYFDEASGILISDKSAEEIGDLNNYSYVALGNDHRTEVYAQGKVVCAGSPEPLSENDGTRHGYYVGEVEGGRLTALKYVKLPCTKYISLVVNVTPETTNAEVVKNIRSEILKRGSANIYRIRLEGPCSPSVKFNLSSLKSMFRISDVADRTEPDYDYSKLFADHCDDMIGCFVKEMNVEDKSPLQKKALNYGINALLKTRSERE